MELALASACSPPFLTKDSKLLHVPMLSHATRGFNLRRVTCSVSKSPASRVIGTFSNPYLHSTRFCQFRSGSLVQEAPTGVRNSTSTGSQRSPRKRKSRRRDRIPDELGSENLSDSSRSESKSDDDLHEVLGQLLSLDTTTVLPATSESTRKKENERRGTEGNIGDNNAAPDALLALLKPGKKERKQKQKEIPPDVGTAGGTIQPPIMTVSSTDPSQTSGGDAAARPVGDPLGKKVLGKAVTMWLSNAASAMARDLVERELREGEVALPRSSVAVVELARSYLRR